MTSAHNVDPLHIAIDTEREANGHSVRLNSELLSLPCQPSYEDG